MNSDTSSSIYPIHTILAGTVGFVVGIQRAFVVVSMVCLTYLGLRVDRSSFIQEELQDREMAFNSSTVEGGPSILSETERKYLKLVHRIESLLQQACKYVFIHINTFHT